MIQLLATTVLSTVATGYDSAKLIAFQLTSPDVTGQIKAPQGVNRFSDSANPNEIGILNFFNALLQLATIIAGLYVLLNIILAGYEYITSSGDSSAHGKVREKITNSVLGLILIAVSYTIVAVLGLLFFGSAKFFLEPSL